MGLALSAKTNDTTLLDFVRAAYPKVIKKDFTVICQQYQNYIVSDWFRGSRVKQEVGSYLTWPMMYKKTENARHVRMFDEDQIAIQDVNLQGHSQWTHFQWSIGWERRELLMAQNNPEKILDLMKSRRASVQLAALDQLEADLWTAPTADSQIPDVPTGIPFWVQRDATTTPAGAWNGGDPSGITGGAAGITVATTAFHKNYTAGYTSVSASDLVKKMRRAIENLNFTKPAIIGDDIPDEGRYDPAIYMGTEVKLDLEDVVAAQNDNLGFALDATRNKATFYGVPVEKVSYLDGSAWTAIMPVYFIDKGSFHAYVLKGDFFVESEPMKLPKAHNQFGVFTDATFQFVCNNRRKNGVISKT